MSFDKRIKNEKPRHDNNREATKIFGLSLNKIDKY